MVLFFTSNALAPEIPSVLIYMGKDKVISFSLSTRSALILRSVSRWRVRHIISSCVTRLTRCVDEELIKYAFPQDVWFHVDKLSSAHICQSPHYRDPNYRGRQFSPV